MEDINHQSVLLVVKLSRPGNRRKVNPGLVQVDADSEAIHVAKDLLDSEELQAVQRFDGSIRRYVYARCLPCSVLKDGIFRLPNSLIDEVDGHLGALATGRVELVGAFLSVYPERVEAARARLRGLFDQGDYPDTEMLRAAFGFEWKYVTFDLPSAGVLSSAVYRREQEKANAAIQSEVEEIRMALRKSFAELIDHATARLAPAPGGKKMVFRDSLIQNLEEFFGYFAQRNIVGDSDLASLVDRARAVLQGVTPEDLRTNDFVRNRVQAAMQEIKQAMSDNLMLAPSRRFFVEPAITAPAPEAAHA